MAVFKIKNPVEYSFLQWMNNHPDSTHWADKERFFRFVKVVARHGANTWKNRQYLKDRILEIMPSFDGELLEARLDLYYDLLDFQATRPLIETGINSSEVTTGHYIEIYVEKGLISEIEVPLQNHRTSR